MMPRLSGFADRSFELVVVVSAFAILWPLSAMPQGPGPGAHCDLLARSLAGGDLGAFPLRQTDIRAQVAGNVAEVEVMQTYLNPFAGPVEAVYIFPLPENAAVRGFVMETEWRRIVAEVRPRQEAVQVYERAKEAGLTAGLLTEERRNVFTQRVANLEPAREVRISITYQEILRYEDGDWSFVFPMVVAQRYSSEVPGTAEGTAGNMPQQPPAAVSPPVLPRGAPVASPVSLTLDIDAGVPICDLKVVTHEVTTETVHLARSIVRMKGNDGVPDRDFVCRWTTAGLEPTFGCLAHRSATSGYFTLLLQPQLSPVLAGVSPREITFIVDVSGSMGGTPIRMAREIVGRALDGLRNGDIFNIVIFSGANAQLWPEPRPGTAAAISEARQFLDAQPGGGGTEMLAGLRRALEATHDPRRLQMYVFITDGLIAEDEGILATIKEHRGGARFFAFGPGPSVNRYLLAEIGRVGRGATYFANPRGGQEEGSCVKDFLAAIDAPVLTDLSIDWNGLPVEDIRPVAVPDLFAGRTLQVIGRYHARAQGMVFIHGKVAGRAVVFPVAVQLPEREASHAMLGALWAREKIAELQRECLGASDSIRAGVVAEITKLGIEHRLSTPFTAFVAVDRTRVAGPGPAPALVQPVPVPEGTFAASSGASESCEINYAMVDVQDEAPDDPLAMSSGGRGLAGAIGLGGGRSMGGSRVKGLKYQKAYLKLIESRILDGLTWFKRHQGPDGCWDAATFGRHCDPTLGEACDGAAEPGWTTEGTALVLLAYLGAGYDPQRTSPYQESVTRGLKWLRNRQAPGGWLAPQTTPEHRVAQAIATIALCEAYRMTRQSAWKTAAQQGLDALAGAIPARTSGPDNPEPIESSLTEACWAALALQAGEAAGVAVDGRAKQRTIDFLAAHSNLATDRKFVSTKAGSTLPALWMLTRISGMGPAPEDPLVRAASQRLLEHLDVESAAPGTIDPVTWYAGSAALQRLGGAAWDRWALALKRALIDRETKSPGCGTGSGCPPDFAGGRLRATAFLTLAVEIYYRYPQVFGFHSR